MINIKKKKEEERERERERERKRKRKRKRKRERRERGWPKIMSGLYYLHLGSNPKYKSTYAWRARKRVAISRYESYKLKIATFVSLIDHLT